MGDADPPSDPEAAREQVIDAMARSADVYGLSRSDGRLFGVLYFADEPLSLDDLVAETGYAKSTVSTAMSRLERFHLVQRRSLPGEGKRAFFEVERDLWDVFQQLLDAEVRREVALMTRALDEAETALSAAEGERADRDLERVRRLNRFYRRTERFVDVFARVPMDRLRYVLDRLRREE